MLYLAAFLISLAVSYFLIPVLIKTAVKYKIVDYPHTSIKTHKIATPYLGGAAIWAGFVVSLISIRYITNFPSGTLRSLRGIIVGGTFLAAIGLIDDIKPIGFKWKFVWQIIGALLLIHFDIRIRFLKPDYLADILTIVWVVGICNAVNIIDIMNGLASGICFISALAFLFISLPTEQRYVNFAAAAVSGGILGFLKYNFPKAKLFMGDSGSLFLGFVMAALSLGTSYTKVNEIALYSPILILGVPIYDTFYVMYLRMLSGRSPFLGSKDHIALRIASTGISRKNVVIILWIASVILSFSAFLISNVNIYVAIFIYAAILALASYAGWRLSKIQME